MTANETLGFEQSDKERSLLEQLNAVGESLILEPREPSETCSNALIFETPDYRSLNNFTGLEQSEIGTTLLEQLDVVGDTFILEPQSEDGETTLVFESSLHSLSGFLNNSNMRDVEKSLNQDEISTVLFPHEKTTSS